MIRKAVLFVLCSTLVACQAHLKPPLPTAPIETPDPVTVDPRLCDALKPEPPVQGGIVQPATAEERTATGAFLEGEAAARDWGRQGWARAAIAKTLCN